MCFVRDLLAILLSAFGKASRTICDAAYWLTFSGKHFFSSCWWRSDSLIFLGQRPSRGTSRYLDLNHSIFAASINLESELIHVYCMYSHPCAIFSGYNSVISCQICNLYLAVLKTVRFCALENPELGTKSWVSVASPGDIRVFTLNRLPYYNTSLASQAHEVGLARGTSITRDWSIALKPPLTSKTRISRRWYKKCPLVFVKRHA